MSSSQKKALIIGSLAALLVLVVISQRHRFSAKTEPQTGTEKTHQTATTQSQDFSHSQDSDTIANQPVNRDETARASLKFMSTLLAKAFDPKTSMDQVVQQLKMSGQKPYVTKSGDPATGRMMMIRTKSPLPGTRYFHAQYFTDEQNKLFVQHMSFEFKPGPQSMNEAIQTAIQSFPLRQPTERKADFIQWDLDDDYVLWIKKKSAADLKDNPFNAYDLKKDLGTVQMTVEMKIHGDSHEGHEH